ncbi:MAG: hypothetical protein HY282_00070 [Nitrospirae bacterium]|nr:hypothetical protein [Candidatus Manganitrophaceae bacterium]
MQISRRFSPYFLMAAALIMMAAPLQEASSAPPAPIDVEVLEHHWRPDVVWEKIGKTKFFWSATVRNHSNARRRIFVYYDLLSADNVPLASNVANKMIEPLQTVEITSDSYINNTFLPQIKNSRVTVKLGFPN